MSLLTAKRRNSLPTSEFAGPDRSYPIQDASHARNALARASGKPVEAEIRSQGSQQVSWHRQYGL